MENNNNTTNNNEQSTNNGWNDSYTYYNQSANSQPNNYYNTNTQAYSYNKPKTSPNGFEIASLVLGIASLVGVLCCIIPGILLGIVAIALGFYGRSKQQDPNTGMSSFSLAGIITGCIGFIVGASLLGLAIYAYNNVDNRNSIFYNDEEYSTDSEIFSYDSYSHDLFN